MESEISVGHPDGNVQQEVGCLNLRAGLEAISICCVCMCFSHSEIKWGGK